MTVVLIWTVFSTSLLLAQPTAAQSSAAPRTWDTRALADWATPLATGQIRPGHFSESEYYRTPLDNYRTYPVYLPDREPAGYWQALKNKKPEPLIDLAKIDRDFKWITAGKRVWDEIDVAFFRLYDSESISMVRSAEYIRKNRQRLIPLPDGTLV